MKNIIVRRAQASDSQFIALLARVTFAETFGSHFRDAQDLVDYFERTFAVQKIENSITNDNNIFWIAFCDDLPVGYAKLKINSASEFIASESCSQLQKIYVLRDFLNQKIGHLLQNEMFEETNKLGSKNLWLSVLKTNERAISFYKKYDFKAVGKHTFNIGKEHFEFLVLKKDF